MTQIKALLSMPADGFGTVNATIYEGNDSVTNSTNVATLYQRVRETK